MPFSPHIQNFFANLNAPLDGISGNRDSPPPPHDGSRARQQHGFARLAQKFDDFARGRGEEKLSRLLSGSLLGQSSANFWTAIGSEIGWNPSHAHQSEDTTSAAHQHQGYRPPAASTSSSDELGGGLHRSFSNMFGVVPPGLEAFLQSRPQQIVSELEDFKRRLTDYHLGDRTGPPPTAPRSIPSHIRHLMTQLDPTDPEYEQTVLDMVRADADVQQSARRQMHDNIGTAPRPKPGHEHGESGGPSEQPLTPDGIPLFPEPDDFDPATGYHNDPNRPAPRRPGS